jgi:DNA-binding transcriptional MocR family regulator
MDLHIDRDGPLPLYRQIFQEIRSLILSGRLPSGYLLPPERRLAEALGVNRTTVVNAYQELKSEGLVDGHVGRGTAVLPSRLTPAGVQGVQGLPWRQLTRDAAAPDPDPLVRDLLELTERRDVITLSVGLPAPELLPVKAMKRIHNDLLARRGAEVLQHSPTEGVTAFREAIGRHMTTRGIQAAVPEILVTSGSQQGLDLIARTFIAPADVVVVEQPSYFGALEVFRSAGARLLGIPADADGMRTDLLEGLLARQRPKLIYTLPTFQNPSGSVLSLERRRQLLELAYAFQVPVVEDDPYSDLRYAGDSLPSLRAMDPHGYVLYLSSFSKVLFPGLRLGWIAAPRAAARRLALAKQSVDLHSNTLGQYAVTQFITEGLFARHLAEVRPQYAHRCQTLLATLALQAPREFTWNSPQGGFYVWCNFPETVSQSRLLALAAQERVSFLPGSASFAEDPGTHHLRLNFSYSQPEQIVEGVARLMRAYRAAQAESLSRNRADLGTPPIV